MEQNKNVNELEYISVENLELLYDNIRKFFTDIHKVDILNYNVKIKEILFENMKLIYGTKHAASLKIKELNIITLKNIKNILEEEINNSGIKNSQDNQYTQPNNPNNIPNNNLDNQYTEGSNKLNVDIINRENNVYDRRNEDNKILMQPSNNGSFNTEQNKNFSNQYDNLLSDRSNALPKREEINFNTQVISSESPDKMNKNMEQLLAEREQLLNKDNNTENSTSQQSLPQQPLPQQPLSSTPIDTSNNNSNLELNLEGFTNDDDNFGTLYEETEKLIQNPSDITPHQQLNEYKPENIDIENVNVNDFNYIPTQIPQELPQELPQENPQENRVVIRKQIIVLNSSKRDLEQYPNPYNYTIDLKIPIQNIVSIKLLNVLININKVRNNINYLLLNLNDFNILTSNHENINEKFAIVFENKIYNEEIIFDEPLESLDKFKIIFTDKNDKIPDTKDTKDSKNILKKNDNIIELLIEYF